jgi:hypothetical protein
MKMTLVKVPNGYAYADADSARAGESHKMGERVVANVVKPRSNKFQRKFFALLRFAFDYWEPAEGDTPPEWRGVTIEKDFDRFREDVTILCGFYTPVWNARGELRMQAKSIAFSEMEPEDFLRLYNTAIGVLMRLVMRSKGFTEQQLSQAVDELLRFDG